MEEEKARAATTADSPMNSALMDMARTVDSLQEELAMLDAKLDPILAPVVEHDKAPVAPGNALADHVPQSLHVGSIKQVTATLRRLTNNVSETRTRLEV